MSDSLTAVAVVLATVVIAPLLLLLTGQCALGARGVVRVGGGRRWRRPAALVLVPAHNEERTLRPTLDAIRRELLEGDRLVVVADNCDDATAKIAADCEARVVERFRPDRRGKGYALAAGIQATVDEPPEFVVVVDADCRPDPGAIDRLVAKSARLGRPVQGCSLVEASDDAPVSQRISALAFWVKNAVRRVGSHRLGLYSLLQGTGMVVPRKMLEGVELATGALAEDLQLGIDLARQGSAPFFAPDVIFRSPIESGDGATSNQRKRWEGGHLAMIGSQLIPTLIAAVRRKDPRLGLLALELAIAPLSLVFGLFLILAIAATATAPGTGIQIAAIVPGIAAGAAVTWSMVRSGPYALSARDWLGLPVYALSKLPIYLHFARRRPTEWVRADRDAPQTPASPREGSL